MTATNQERTVKADPMSGPAISDVLHGRYVLEEHIASGGMASVWRAHDEVLARTVAIKILHPELARLATVRERFRREAIAAAKLVHPAIVALFDTGVDDRHVYLSMEYVEARTVADVLADGPMEIEEAARIGARVAAALAHAHDRGLVHRDIKPQNILLAADGGVKVTDFGIAKAAQDTTDPGLTDTGRVMGTAAYLAPEQLRGHAVDRRADLYSLGLVLYESLTGTRPFVGDTPMEVAEARLDATPRHPRELRADIPRPLDALVARLTDPNPSARPDDAEQVATGLTAFAGMPAGPPELDDPPAGLTSGDASIRSEVRWLLPVGLLLVLAASLVGVAGLGAIPDGDRPSLPLSVQEVTPSPVRDEADGPSSDQGDDEGDETVDLSLRTPVAYDPQGSDGERDEYLSNLVDGQSGTEWATEQYHSPEFGNLKDGVGVVVDLGEPTAPADVTLVVPRGGFGLELRMSDRIDPDPTAWVTVASVDAIGAGRNTYELSDPPARRYLLVWVTGDLQPYEGRFRAELGEIEVSAVR